MTDKTIIISDENATARFIRKGVRFEELMNLISSYSEDVGFTWFSDSDFHIRPKNGELVFCCDFKSAVTAFLDALIESAQPPKEEDILEGCAAATMYSPKGVKHDE